MRASLGKFESLIQIEKLKMDIKRSAEETKETVATLNDFLANAEYPEIVGELLADAREFFQDKLREVEMMQEMVKVADKYSDILGVGIINGKKR